jgi:hypothetical protein
MVYNEDRTEHVTQSINITMAFYLLPAWDAQDIKRQIEMKTISFETRRLQLCKDTYTMSCCDKDAN